MSCDVYCPLNSKMSRRRFMVRVTRCVGQMATVLLLLLYLIGSSNVELFHSFAHDDEILITHSDEQEKDPCHRLIYHSDVKDGCGHESHLVVADKCSMCDVAYQSDQGILKIFTFKSAFPFEVELYSRYKTDLDSYWAVISSSRAPPALI